MNTGSSRNNTSEGCEADGEDKEESSSSSSNKIRVKAKSLDEFRKEWKKEIEKSPHHVPKKDLPNGEEVDQIKENDEDKAKVLFQLGVENEEKGRLYEAIQYYRRAVQLVPDIELRLFQQSLSQTTPSTPAEEVIGDTVSPDDLVAQKIEEDDDSAGPDEEFDPESTDLLTHLQIVTSRQQALCHPHYATTSTHISALPMEIFLYILRWVVSADLDLRSLEMCAAVCRGFYVCCRDPEIWRIACTRVWGMRCLGGGPCSSGFSSWREMFITRPRLHYSGVYISKATYVRLGENQFQDQFYRPWRIVIYFRYLRFFVDGRVLMLTTPDEPAGVVGLLRPDCWCCKSGRIAHGYYRLVEDNTVSIVLGGNNGTNASSAVGQPPKSRSNNYNSGHTFHMELEITSPRKKRRHNQLIWRGYSVFTRANGIETRTPFDLPASRYPPFWFSRVKSYNAETLHPLAY
ncbi:F-box only protein 9 isoform X2 [Rhodnius prolixus]|uniref:F-box only protein 9 isoform X2 n=1 Tax=Rhodnius prolixus TaxID=13249 RepID=UPI003D187A87